MDGSQERVARPLALAYALQISTRRELPSPKSRSNRSCPASAAGGARWDFINSISTVCAKSVTKRNPPPTPRHRSEPQPFVSAGDPARHGLGEPSRRGKLCAVASPL